MGRFREMRFAMMVLATLAVAAMKPARLQELEAFVGTEPVVKKQKCATMGTPYPAIIVSSIAPA